MTTWDRQDVAGIGSLADPVRRELYRYVCAQPDPVSREQAADALQIPAHRAKFHLDRLEAEGLLQTGFARVTGRTGPGAGRTSKLYHRAPREFSVSLPDREYELAGRMMADAIVESTRTGIPVQRALEQAAAAHGRAMATGAAPARDDSEQATDRPAPGHGPGCTVPTTATDAESALSHAVEVLRDNGYEPRREGDAVVMANCPFHALAHQHTELVCGMNHAMLTAMTETLAPGRLQARLAPGENRCCVVLHATGSESTGPA